ncbi:MAG TPA: hypothetical protein DCS04_02805 [Ruminococcaceae bacterium]|nr:hypothetical protein [Oscillospiraceae bacterium]
MKKIISVLILVSILVSFALVPVHAAESSNDNLPYCFYYEFEDSLGTYFCTQFFIEHTGQTFHRGHVTGNLFTSSTVPTNDHVYMNNLFGVRYNTSESTNFTGKSYVIDLNYLDGNHNYFYSMDPEYIYNFDETKVVNYVLGCTSISEDHYPSIPTEDFTRYPGIKSGYRSLVTGEVYAYTIRKTLSQILSHGHDYLDELE